MQKCEVAMRLAIWRIGQYRNLENREGGGGTCVTCDGMNASGGRQAPALALWMRMQERRTCGGQGQLTFHAMDRQTSCTVLEWTGLDWTGME